MGGTKSQLKLPENDVVVTSYISLRGSGRRRRCASSVPLAVGQFRRTAAKCPLPRKVFTPFPACDQAVGHIIRSFDALPPAQCYRRFIAKHPPDRLFHRIECLFLPNDEGHLMVCSGLYYLLPPNLVALRVNGLYDGLVAQWSLEDEGRSYRCSVIRGSRSDGASGCAMTRLGRFLAWPSKGRVVVFDRYAATTCRIDKFQFIDSMKAVDFSPDRLHLAVVSSNFDHVLLRVMTNFDAGCPSSFQVISEMDLTRFDFNMRMRSGHDLVSVKFSPSGRSIAVGCQEGSFMILSTVSNQPILVNLESFESSRNEWLHNMRLANYKAFDYTPVNPRDNDACERLAFANASGEVILCIISQNFGAQELASHQLIPTNDEQRRINCLRCANVEPWLAVGISSGEVILLHNQTLRPLSRLPLEGADFDPPLAYPHHARGFTSLCFSCTDSYLAGGVTDGRVRVWCLKKTIGPLTELCRRRIRSLCPKEQVKNLPLHPAILDYLSESLVYRTDVDNDE